MNAWTNLDDLIIGASYASDGLLVTDELKDRLSNHDGAASACGCRTSPTWPRMAR